MQRYGLSRDHAFEPLLRYAQTSNIKLRTPAEDLPELGGISNQQTLTPGADLEQALRIDPDRNTPESTLERICGPIDQVSVVAR